MLNTELFLSKDVLCREVYFDLFRAYFVASQTKILSIPIILNYLIAFAYTLILGVYHPPTWTSLKRLQTIANGVDGDP